MGGVRGAGVRKDQPAEHSHDEISHLRSTQLGLQGSATPARISEPLQKHRCDLVSLHQLGHFGNEWGRILGRARAPSGTSNELPAGLRTAGVQLPVSLCPSSAPCPSLHSDTETQRKSPHRHCSTAMLSVEARDKNNVETASFFQITCAHSCLQAN